MQQPKKFSEDTSDSLAIARLVGSFLIVLLHVSGYGFYAYDENWNAANIANSFSRIGTPIFVMITGALLIGRHKSNYFKYVGKVIVVILFWSAFYNIADNVSFKGLINWLASVISHPQKYHLWYLYSCIGFYLTMPILDAFYSLASKNQLITTIAVWFLVSTLICISMLTSETNIIDYKNYQIEIFSSLIIYLLIGKIISDNCSNKQKRNVFITQSAIIYILSSSVIVILTFYFSSLKNSPNPLFYNMSCPLVIIASVSAFYFILACKKNDKIVNVLKPLSRLTLGVYCIHIFVLERVKSLFFPDSTFSFNLASTITIAFLIFSISLILSFIARKFKILRLVF